MNGIDLIKARAFGAGGGSGGSGGGSELLDAYLELTLTSVHSNAKSICDKAFYVREIQHASFPFAETVGNSAFYSCKSLESIELPAATHIGDYCFYDCIIIPELKNVRTTGKYALQKADISVLRLPKVASVMQGLCESCTSLEIVDLPIATDISGYAFQKCPLIALIIRTNSVCILGAATALNSTGVKNGTGYIYVPSALVDTYKAETNWSTYAAQFRALEDYTVDGTTTGELDPEKIGA